MFKLKADVLIYYFIENKVIYSIPFGKLRRWAFGRKGSEVRSLSPGRIYDFPEKQQKKTCQLNDTWGRCVPIVVIEKEVGFKKYEGDNFVPT